jgi:hypothetical protein
MFRADKSHDPKVPIRDSRTGMTRADEKTSQSGTCTEYIEVSSDAALITSLGAGLQVDGLSRWHF